MKNINLFVYGSLRPNGSLTIDKYLAEKLLDIKPAILKT